jgi:HD-GYP domain-containing protein (c-di-GMP phosphodiesterase class II)
MLATSLLDLWERGQNRIPAVRALEILSAANPSQAHSDLAALPLDRRNQELLAIRCDLFGRALEFYTVCPACSGALEFEVDAGKLSKPEPVPPGSELETGGYRLFCRAPNSHDLLAATAGSDPHAQRRILIERCVVEAHNAAGEVDPVELPGEVIDEAEAWIEQHSPRIEISFDLECPECGHRWKDLFDVVSFLWREIDAHSKRLMAQVAVLARRCGWSEAEVLAMSSARRAAYLELVGA